MAEEVVQRAVKPSAQTTPQLGLLESRVTSITDTTTMTTATHTPLSAAVIPVEPMPAPIPGQPSPYHGVDFCIPVGPDFSLVTGR